MNLNYKIRSYKNNLSCLPWKLFARWNLYKDKGAPIKYISEDANWAIKTVGLNIKKEIDEVVKIFSNKDKFLGLGLIKATGLKLKQLV